LKTEHLDNFESWWTLSLEAVDETNLDRGGWSTVYTYRHKGKLFYVKRQSNHLSRSLSSGLRKIPTFEMEFQQIGRYIQNEIPCIDPVFFETRKVDGELNLEYQAILVSEALEGCIALDALLYGGEAIVYKRKVQLCAALASSISHLHSAGIEHYNLYPKHIFIRPSADGFEVRFIDLETSRSHFGLLKKKCRDIETLPRRTIGVSKANRLRFLLQYFGKTRVDPQIRRTIGIIQKRSD
jgi:hypothetical protein